MHNLKNKTILLTGACGGIGRAIAKALSDAGARLVLTDLHSDKLVELLSTLGDQHAQFAADISHQEDRKALLGFCIGLARPLDMLINVAGVNRFAVLADHSDSDLEKMLTINLLSQIALTRDVLPILLKQPQARVINIGSILGSIGMPGYSVYCATKFGLRGFSESLNRELLDTGVRVRYFAPRATQTALNEDRVNEMNKALGNTMDSPERVAEQLVTFLKKDRPNAFLGWPEKLFVRINSVLPGLVDKSFLKQLPVIKRYL